MLYSGTRCCTGCSQEVKNDHLLQVDSPEHGEQAQGIDMDILDSKAVFLHVCTAMHVYKQIGLDMNYANATMVLDTAYFELDDAKTEYAQLAKATKKNAKEQKEKGANPNPDINATSSPLATAKAACEEAATKVKEANLAITRMGAKPFKLYYNLLSDKARQPWEKVMKAQLTKAPWENVFRNIHTETPTKTWDSFSDCVKFYLQTVIQFDAGEAL